MSLALGRWGNAHNAVTQLMTELNHGEITVSVYRLGSTHACTDCKVHREEIRWASYLVRCTVLSEDASEPGYGMMDATKVADFASAARIENALVERNGLCVPLDTPDAKRIAKQIAVALLREARRLAPRPRTAAVNEDEFLSRWVNEP